MTRTIILPGIALPVTALSLGTAGYGPQVPQDAIFALLDAYVAQGGNCIDTAYAYGGGASERAIGAWLASRGGRAALVIATKGCQPEWDQPQRARVTPEDLATDLTASLDRLGVPHVELYWLHRDDPAVPVDEILDALLVHVSAGRIGALGASNWRPARIAAFNACARARGVAGFIASQIAWNLLAAAEQPPRPHENLAMTPETLAWHRASGLPVIPYSTQARGFFAKPLPPGTAPVDRERWHRVAELAKRRGTSPNAIALAYVLDHPCGGSAIIGPRNPEQLTDSMSAAGLRLSTGEIAWLESGARG